MEKQDQKGAKYALEKMRLPCAWVAVRDRYQESLISVVHTSTCSDGLSKTSLATRVKMYVP